MTIWDALILSVIEGFSEFLPISSTGHLILTSKLLGIDQTTFVTSFEIFIQLGAVMAVIVMYWRTLLMSKTMLARIGVAFIPSAVVGLVFYGLIKRYLLTNPWVVVVSLFFGGIVIIAVELFHKHKTAQTDSLKQAFLVGLAQSLSVIPGVSRAAATIVGGQLVGLSRQSAVEFSFLLAIPTMAAATGLDLIKSDAWKYSSGEAMLLVVGFAGSFVTAFFVVKLFLTFIGKNNFIPFGIYRIVLSILYGALVLR